MRQVHKAGEKCFVDYSGNKPTIVDRATGERVEVERDLDPRSVRRGPAAACSNGPLP